MLHRALPILMIVMLLAGCTKERQQMRQALSGKPPVIAGSLEGEWLVADLNGGGAPGPRMRLKFEGGDHGTSSVSGSTGCNRFQARWQQDGAKLALTMGAVTMRACEPGPTEIEGRFLALLPAITDVTYTEAGEAILTAPDGRRMLLKRLPAPAQQ